MKLLLEQLCEQAGVEVHLHTRVCAALRSPGNRLDCVVTESKSGREAFCAKTFVDCTGDGDLAASAGCQFDLGHPETGRTQPMSLMALVAGLSAEEAAGYYRDDDARAWASPKDKLREAMESGGHSPSYAKPRSFICTTICSR